MTDRTQLLCIVILGMIAILSIAGALTLAFHRIEVPTPLWTAIAGVLGTLGGILVPRSKEPSQP